MRPCRSVLLVAAFASAFAIAACGSGTASSATTQVSGAWARSAPAAGGSAAYFRVTNTSTTSDALLSVSSPDAGMVQMHETTTDASGMTGMQPVSRVDVPASTSVEFKPGGYHVMLMSLSGALEVGKTIELDLVFEHAGKVVVKAEIRRD